MAVVVVAVTDYRATPLAVAFWKLSATPEQPLIIERVTPQGPVETARWPTEQPCKVIPDTATLGTGLYIVTHGYKAANGDARQKRTYYLIYGTYGLLHLTDALGNAIEAAIRA